VDPQQDDLCALHTVNTAMQRCVITARTMRTLAAALPTDECPKGTGNYTLYEVLRSLAVVAPHLRLSESFVVHRGASDGVSWADTLTTGGATLQSCDCAMLTLIPRDYASVSHASLLALNTHHVAAVKVDSSWFALDSLAPDRAYPLSDAAVSSAFNAFVTCFGSTEHPRALSRSEALDLLPRSMTTMPLPANPATAWVPSRRADADRTPSLMLHAAQCGHVASSPPCTGTQTPSYEQAACVRPTSREGTPLQSSWDRPAWPCAPVADATTHAPVRVILFAPPLVIRDRPTYLRYCDRHGMHALLAAKFNVDNDHLDLTVAHPPHAAQITADFESFKAAVENATGWRVVPGPSLADPPPRATAGVRYVDQHGFSRPRRMYHAQRDETGSSRPALRSTNPFAVLADEDCPTASTDTVGTTAGCPATATASPPTPPRVARKHATGCEYIGTANVFDLGGPHALAELLALQVMMEERQVAVLAVQETKILRSREHVAKTKLRYFGTRAYPTLHGRRSGGTGFMVREGALDFFTFLGPRSGHKAADEHFAAQWARVHGPTCDQDLWIASVYLPNSSRYITPADKRLYADTMADIDADITFYSRKPGTVVLMGDWNARVGNPASSELAADGKHSHLRAHAPALGETKCTEQGRMLLQLCHNHDLEFKSGVCANSEGPTCVGFPNGARDGKSVVDHIIASRSTQPSAPPLRCIRLESEEVVGLQSDHVPLLLHFPVRARKARVTRTYRTRYRLEQLRDKDTALAYMHAVNDAASAYLSSSPPCACGDQAGADAAAHEAARIFEQAAAASIGTRTVRDGVTKRWLSRETAQALDAKRKKYRDYITAPADERAAAALDLANHARSTREACRTEQRALNKRREDACVSLWQDHPGSRAAYTALNNLARTPDQSSIESIEHPHTGELCHTAAAKAEALACHYATLASEAVPEHPEGVAQLRRSQAVVDSCRGGNEAGPDALASAWTLHEVQAGLRALANNKAPGEDELPAELLKCGGESGARVLCKLFNTVYSTECIPVQWRKGVVTSLHKKAARTDPNNYRGLTLMPVMDKLFCILMTNRLGNHVPLHDQQYAFRRGRGTLNALFNVVNVVQDRLAQGLPTFAFFLDAHKAYDTVSHTMLLDRLAAKGVTGKAWRVVDQMYAHATSRTRVSGAMSDPFPVERGVAQGCPLSPFLYDIFVDSLLEDIHAVCGPDGIHVGGRRLVGQSYADDMTALANSPDGMQRIIDVVRRHSQRWGWQANVQKSVTLVFGDAAAQAAAGSHTWQWGEHALTRVHSIRYLGVHLHESGSWDGHVQQAAHKGTQVLHKWARVLTSGRLPVRHKLRLINSHLRPVMEYGMEVWGPGDIRGPAATKLLKPIDDVLLRATKMAAGVHATATEGAGLRQRGVTAHVLFADMHILQAVDACGVAHVRYNERTRAAAAQTATLAQSVAPSAYQAPDLMGAAVRASLLPHNAWRSCVDALEPVLSESRAALSAAGAPPRLPNCAIGSAVRSARCAERAALGATEPPPPTVSSRGRRVKRAHPGPDHLNPIRQLVLEGAAAELPPYLRLPTPVTLPVLALRSCHLPGDHTAAAAKHYASDCCNLCGACVIEDVGSGEYTVEERRWRHIQHLLCGCRVRHYPDADGWGAMRVPELSELRADLLDSLPVSCHSAVRDACACDPTDVSAVRQTLMPLFLDPVLFLGDGAPAAAVALASRFVAAYLVQVGAKLARVVADRTRLTSLWLPPGSRVAQASPYRAVDWGSDDEVWLREDSPGPPPDSPPPPAVPTRSAREGARPKPVSGRA